MVRSSLGAAECDQEIEARIPSFESTNDPVEETADAPPTPTESPAKPFNLKAHLTRLFGTDLTLIPGIGESTALILFTEFGPDLSRFPTAGQFASWLNLCPNNQITGGRIISAHTGPRTNRAAQERQDLRRLERRLRNQARALGYVLVPVAA